MQYIRLLLFYSVISPANSSHPSGRLKSRCVCVSNLQVDAVNEECDHVEQSCGTGGDTCQQQIGHHVHQFLVIVVIALLLSRVLAISLYETVLLVGAFACSFTGFDLRAYHKWVARIFLLRAIGVAMIFSGGARSSMIFYSGPNSKNYRKGPLKCPKIKETKTARIKNRQINTETKTKLGGIYCQVQRTERGQIRSKMQNSKAIK